MKYSHAAVALSVFLLIACDEGEVNKKETRLEYYVESFDIPDLGFTPQTKISYQYGDGGHLINYTVAEYNPSTSAFVEQRYATFSYANEKLESIKGFFISASTPYFTHTYTYLPNGNVSTIHEDNDSAGISSTAAFDYSDNGNVTVSYTYSNGGSFDYQMEYIDENIINDKTLRGTQICNEGTYTYDQHKNPFKSLGYTDYFLFNFSTNNKLTENVNYIGCYFPELLPESYEHVYNDAGYPTTTTTFYKTKGGIRQSKKEFSYIER